MSDIVRWCWYRCRCGNEWLHSEEPENIITAFFPPKRRCPNCGRKVTGENEKSDPSPWEGVGGY
jgi:hypothetical protein